MVARISSWTFLWPFVGFFPHLWWSESPIGARGCKRFSWRAWRQKLCDRLLPMATEISNWKPWEKRFQLEPELAKAPIGDSHSHWEYFIPTWRPCGQKLCDCSLPLAIEISNWSSWEKRLQLEAVLAASPNGDFDSHLWYLPPIGGSAGGSLAVIPYHWLSKSPIGARGGNDSNWRAREPRFQVRSFPTIGYANLQLELVGEAAPIGARAGGVSKWRF